MAVETYVFKLCGKKKVKEINTDDENTRKRNNNLHKLKTKPCVTNRNVRATDKYGAFL